jgi:arylsulfatase A-like enzyme
MFTVLTAASLALASAAPRVPFVSAQGPAAAPKVVVFVVDDAGPELFGAYDAYYATVTGQPSGEPAATPAIDGFLAAQGVSFAHAWGNPVCSPTRSCLLTGRYTYRTGVGTFTSNRPTPLRTGLSPTLTLLPQVLHTASPAFRCVALGKWHLAERSQLDADPQHPLGQPAGHWFDAWAGTYFSLAAPEGLDPFTYGYSVWKKSIAANPHSLSDLCAPAAPPCQVQMSAPPLAQYATVDTAEDALQCLREANGPLLLYVSFNAIHMPVHDVPTGLPAPTCAGYTPPAVSCDFAPTLTPTQERARCMLESLDTQIGRVLCEVDFDTTTVILIGDNGTPKNVLVPPYPPNHAKSTTYEGGIRVPLIVRSPLTPVTSRGTFVEAPVHAVDLFATVCELAGVVAPPGTGVDSVSLVPYLQGGTAPQRDYVYAEEFFPNFTPDPATGAAPTNFGAKHHAQAISDGKYKLIRYSRRGSNGSPPVVREQFYDLLAGGPPTPTQPTSPDYFEQYDLLALGSLSPDSAAVLELLRGVLDQDFPYLTR